MIKVLIADDEPLVRAGIKTVLPWNMYGFDVISEAADGKEAVSYTHLRAHET